MVQAQTYETLFVARQPVLDAALGTWGYFHYYRRSQEHTYSEFTDPLQATLAVIQCMPACLDTCSLPHKALIQLPGQALLAGVPHALSPACVVPVIPLNGYNEPKHLEALATLRRDGYSLALDPQGGELGETPLLDLADIVILDLRGPKAEQLIKMAPGLRAAGLTLLAKRVETVAAFNLAKSLGCTQFSGYFFREPEVLSQRKVSAVETTRLTLLNLLAQPDPNTDELVATIEADASVSYRVLSLLNSASFSLAKKVASVRQAVLMAGWVNLCAWLRVIVLADLAPSSKARELLHLSAQRAKFFELLALSSGRQAKADSLFMLGLFSLLPSMLDMPMPGIVERLALEDDLAAALCGQPSPYDPWLALALAIEETRWDDMGQLVTRLGLPTGSVAEAYNASFSWADKLTNAMPGENGKTFR